MLQVFIAYTFTRHVLERIDRNIEDLDSGSIVILLSFVQHLKKPRDRTIVKNGQMEEMSKIVLQDKDVKVKFVQLGSAGTPYQ